MILVSLLVLLIGMWLGFVLPYLINSIVSKRERNRELEALIPGEIDDFRMCNNPHVWIETLGVTDESEYAPINVCSKCGFIPSKNLMATSEGLKRIIQNKAIREFEESVANDFVDKERADINTLVEELKSNPTVDVAMFIYLAGQSANKRYIIYKIARSEEKRREPKEDV